MSFNHKPVLLHECIEYLDIKSDGIYVDCTVGGAGHSFEIAQKLGSSGHLIGIDQDEMAITAAQERLQSYEEQVTLIRDNFINLKRVLFYQGFEEIDGILFDLGFSSPQVDEEERGFSYQQDAPLDMRMDKRIRMTAAKLINFSEEKELFKIINEYGEERWAKRIAQFIVRERAKKQIKTTSELVRVIKAAIPASARRTGPHPAKRTFQALRIAVNDELNVLKKALKDAVSLLKNNGRLCVISFHSLEDRIVKNFFKEQAIECKCPKDFPVCVCDTKPELKIITRKPVQPTEKEILENPRSRSALLRVAEKI